MTFSTLGGFGDQTITVVLLILTAGISSHVMFGFGTRKAKETFVLLILLLIVGVQMFYLIPAAILVPANRFYTWNERYHRQDCLNSGKGGKRPMGERHSYDMNPCYCHAGASCIYADSNKSAFNASIGCPRVDGVICLDSFANKIHAYISSKRDCSGGRGNSCSMDQPCTPCDKNSLHLWGPNARCRECSSENDGDCYFIEGIGPYCLDKPGSINIVPCKKCCTEPGPVILINSSLGVEYSMCY